MQPANRISRLSLWTLKIAAALLVASAAVPLLAAPPLEWKEVDGVKIPVPPKEHPRLYLRSQQVAQLPERLQDPVLQPIVERMEGSPERSSQRRVEREREREREARPSDGERTERSRRSSSTSGKVEWAALRYLAHPDRAQGRATIAETLELLKKTELADRQDACRFTGRMMVTGAIVYDWLYPLLTADEKQAFIGELIRLAKTLECGYPPVRQGSVTGHSSEAMIMRDLLSAGIAIYDEFPEMYELAAARFFREHLPARNWFYNGHAYHQGDSYGLHRYSWDTFPLWIFDRLGAGNVYNPAQRFVPYHWVYATRPDGQRLRGGDNFVAHNSPRGEPWGEFTGTLFTASYYGDGTLLSQSLQQDVGHGDALFTFLWRDTKLEPKPIEALPLFRYFGSPFGWMVARTGWDRDAVVAEMKVNEYNFTNHQHADAGAFQIYYRGALALDSGLYHGLSGNSKYGSPHCKNYYWRTIAHNSLLVYDPDEDFGAPAYGNDGGQRLPNHRGEVRTLDDLLSPAMGYRTGTVLSHGFGPDPQTPQYTLLEGDLTAAYNDKVRRVTRSFAFLNLGGGDVPAAMVVFDRVASADPQHRKFWLLHTQEEPRVEGTSAVVECTQPEDTGRLTLDVLLPAAENCDLSTVGGPGKEFWVFGTNYPADSDDPRDSRDTRDSGNTRDNGDARENDGRGGRQSRGNSLEPGAWRIELSPKKPAADDLFLTVMQVTDRTSPGRLVTTRFETGTRVGALIESSLGNRLVLFNRNAARSSEPVTVKLSGPGETGVLVANLAPGKWRVQRVGDAASREVEVSKELGAAWFEASPGEWRLER